LNLKEGNLCQKKKLKLILEYNMYTSPSIIRIIKSRWMRWAVHLARMGARRNAHGIWGENQKRLLGRPPYRWMDNIKMDLRERGWYGMDMIDLAQDRGHVA
jgi:hypothetical protein